MKEQLSKKSNDIGKDLKRVVIVVLSALLSAIAINMFVVHSKLIPGGFMGLSTLIKSMFEQFLDIDVPYEIIYYILNLPLVIIVYKYVGKKFTKFSILNILMFGVFTAIVPKIQITDDRLLMSVFGGVLSAMGSLGSLQSNASSGGLDFVAIYTANKFKKATWGYTMAFNVAIILLGVYLYDVNAAMYSIIYQATANFIVRHYHSRYRLITLHIFTDYPDEIASSVLQKVRHSITRFDGIGMYSKQHKSMLYIVCNQFEVREIISCISVVDPKAFINEMESRKVRGNYFLKPLE